MPMLVAMWVTDDPDTATEPHGRVEHPPGAPTCRRPRMQRVSPTQQQLVARASSMRRRALAFSDPVQSIKSAAPSCGPSHGPSGLLSRCCLRSRISPTEAQTTRPVSTLLPMAQAQRPSPCMAYSDGPERSPGSARLCGGICSVTPQRSLGHARYGRWAPPRRQPQFHGSTVALTPRLKPP